MKRFLQSCKRFIKCAKHQYNMQKVKNIEIIKLVDNVGEQVDTNLKVWFENVGSVGGGGGG